MILLEMINGAGQGNQMFMFARAYALARKSNQKILIIFSTKKEKIESRPFILDKFKIDKRYIYKIIRLDKYNQIIRVLILKFYRFLYKKILKSNVCIEEQQKHRNYIKEEKYKYHNYYLCGYFESYKYFNKYREDLIKQFEPNYQISSSTKKILNEIRNSNSVALHIRRGDFVLEGKDAGTEYYKKQMKIVENEIENPIFYLATIDNKIIEEFKKYNNVRIINTMEENKDINDWLCLKECKHHIIANSTYSWWAAYLSNNKNKKVYMPTDKEYKQFEKRECLNEYENFYWKEK